MKRRSQKGLTLPEVLIALLVFSMIASASVYALRLGVESRDQLDAADRALKNLQIARILIKEDLAQIVQRPVRDEFGSAGLSVFTGGQAVFAGRVEDDETVLFSFVRNGWINPGSLSPRSALQHVEYVFRDGAVVRRSRAYLDEASNGDETERLVFEGLADARAEFLNGELRGELVWAEAWPVAAGAQAVRPPRAVALILEEDNVVPLRQLFWIGDLGGARL